MGKTVQEYYADLRQVNQQLTQLEEDNWKGHMRSIQLQQQKNQIKANIFYLETKGFDWDCMTLDATPALKLEAPAPAVCDVYLCELCLPRRENVLKLLERQEVRLEEVQACIFRSAAELQFHLGVNHQQQGQSETTPKPLLQLLQERECLGGFYKTPWLSLPENAKYRQLHQQLCQLARSPEAKLLKAAQ